MEYHSLNNLNDSDRSSLTSVFQGILTSLKHISVNKAISYLRYIPEQCRMHHNSIENRKLRSSHEKKFHPVKPYRGEPSRIIVTDITTIDKARLGRRIGRLTRNALPLLKNC